MVDTLDLDLLVDKEEHNIHYNIENIAYLRVDEEDITKTGWMLLALPIVVSLVLVPFTDLLILGLGGGISFAALLLLNPSNMLEIGTLNDVSKFNTNNADSFEEMFKEKVPSRITISGKISDTAKDTSYRYHFIPGNIVAIKKNKRSNGLLGLVFLIGTGVALLYLGISYNSLKYNTPANEFLFQIIGTSIIYVIFIILLVYLPSGISTRLDIELKNGDTKKFPLYEPDADKVIRKFKNI